MENLIGFIVLFIVFGLIGALAFWYGWRTVKKNQAAATWPTVTGKIIGAELDSYIKTDDDGDKTTMYTPLITYEYVVEGETYTCTRVRVQAPVATNFQSVQLKELEKYPIGSAVEVHYDPFNPEDALLKLDPAKINVPMIFGIICGLVSLYSLVRMILSL